MFLLLERRANRNAECRYIYHESLDGKLRISCRYKHESYSTAFVTKVSTIVEINLLGVYLEKHRSISGKPKEAY